MTLVEMLEQQLEELVASKLGGRKHPLFDEELTRHRKMLCSQLLEALAGVPIVKEEPSQEILDRARKLQALALNSNYEHERSAAWGAFEKLWQKYNLPPNLGL